MRQIVSGTWPEGSRAPGDRIKGGCHLLDELSPRVGEDAVIDEQQIARRQLDEIRLADVLPAKHA